MSTRSGHSYRSRGGPSADIAAAFRSSSAIPRVDSDPRTVTSATPVTLPAPAAGPSASTDVGLMAHGVSGPLVQPAPMSSAQIATTAAGSVREPPLAVPSSILSTAEVLGLSGEGAGCDAPIVGTTGTDNAVAPNASLPQVAPTIGATARIEQLRERVHALPQPAEGSAAQGGWGVVVQLQRQLADMFARQREDRIRLLAVERTNASLQEELVRLDHELKTTTAGLVRQSQNGVPHGTSVDHMVPPPPARGATSAPQPISAYGTGSVPQLTDFPNAGNHSLGMGHAAQHHSQVPVGHTAHAFGHTDMNGHPVAHMFAPNGGGVATEATLAPASQAIVPYGTQAARPKIAGPYAPGLAPLRSSIHQFNDVIDYRRYRLPDTNPEPSEEELKYLHRLKQRIDNLHPQLGHFDGTVPIELLPFLTTFSKALFKMNKSEGVAVRVLSYFLRDEALGVYETQSSPGSYDLHNELHATYPYVVQSLIEHFLTDDVLQDAHSEVALARQRPTEDEMAFGSRIADASRRCMDVFAPSELVNVFQRGLSVAVRTSLQEHMRSWTEKDRVNLTKVRRTAYNLGSGQRHAALENSSASTSQASSRKTPTRKGVLHIGTHDIRVPCPQVDTTTTGSTREDPPTPVMALTPVDQPTEQHGSDGFDPVLVLETAIALEGVFLASNPDFQGLDQATRQVGTKEVPQLTPDQIEQAKAVLPRDSSDMICWTCGEEGHSQFRCPYVPEVLRIFTAYRFYLSQIARNPSLIGWYKARADALRGTGPDPGPKPSSARNGRQQPRGPVKILQHRAGSAPVNVVSDREEDSTNSSGRSENE